MAEAEIKDTGTAGVGPIAEEAGDDLEKVLEVVANYRRREGVLVPVLQDIQRELGYLPEHALRIASRELDLPFAQVHGVASFYAQFYFTPRGRNIIQVCVGTACHIRGSQRILERFENELGIKAGETTEDLEFTLETVSCVGCCGLAPVVVANEKVIKQRDLPKLIARLRNQGEE